MKIHTNIGPGSSPLHVYKKLLDIADNALCNAHTNVEKHAARLRVIKAQRSFYAHQSRLIRERYPLPIANELRVKAIRQRTIQNKRLGVYDDPTHLRIANDRLRRLLDYYPFRAHLYREQMKTSPNKDIGHTQKHKPPYNNIELNTQTNMWECVTCLLTS